MAHSPANFDALARPYRRLEYMSFGPYLERCRFHFLDQLGDHRRALVLGDGDGRFTARLLAANPTITVDAIDSSAKMLGVLKESVSCQGNHARKRLRAVHSDAREFRLQGAPYDLVVTHFFLDCLSEPDLARLVARIRPHLAPEATWLVSEFAIPATQPAAALARLVIATLYRAFRILTGMKTQSLPNYAGVFQQNNMAPAARRSFLGGLLVAEIWRAGSNP